MSIGRKEIRIAPVPQKPELFKSVLSDVVRILKGVQLAFRLVNGGSKNPNNGVSTLVLNVGEATLTDVQIEALTERFGDRVQFVVDQNPKI